MTRICTLSSDRALSAQTTSFSIPETCVRVMNESTMIRDGHVVARSPRMRFIADWLDVSTWLICIVCTFSSTDDLVGPLTDMGPRGGH